VRSFDEIAGDINGAMQSNNADVLTRLVQELDEHETPLAQGYARNLSGWVAYLRADYKSAIREGLQAINIFESIDEKASLARSCGNLGLAYNQLGDVQNALLYTKRDLALKEELRDPRASACHGNLGLIYLYDGQYAEAMESMNKALDLATINGDEHGVILNTGNLGNVYMRTGDYPQALANFHFALAGYERLGNTAYAAVISGNIGLVLQETHKRKEAQEWFNRALSLYQQTGDKHGISKTHLNLASAYSNLQQYEEALEHLDRGQQIAEQIGYTKGLNDFVLARCHIHRDRGEIELLRDLLSAIDPESLHSAYQTSYALAVGAVLRADGDLDGLLELYLRVLDVALAANARRDAMTLHAELRDLAKERMDFDSYVQHSEAYQALREELEGTQAMEKIAVMDKERAIAEERQLRDRERAVLHSALPPLIADRIIAGESVTGDHHDSAAVLFLDVAGFTVHSSEMDPQDTTALLASMFTKFDEICDQHKITKIKTIGDSYMAVAFGNEEGQSAEGPEVGRRAATAALEMLASDFYWPTATADGNSNRVQFRVGLHVGPVVAGVIGTTRLQYDVWGDTVNVASRMESTGEPGKIQCSESFERSFASAQDDVPARHPEERSDEGPLFTFTRRGSIEIKGKGPMTTYWLEGA